MKKSLIVCAFACALSLVAAEVKFDWSKSKIGENKAPGWGVNAMGKYEGLGKVTVVEGPQKGTMALQCVTQARSTAYFRAAAIKAKAGDTVKITAKVKGTGKISLGVYSYSKSGFVPAPTPHKTFDVSSELKDIVYEFELLESKTKDKDGNLKTVATIRPTFTIVANSDFIIEDIIVEVTNK